MKTIFQHQNLFLLCMTLLPLNTTKNETKSLYLLNIGLNL